MPSPSALSWIDYASGVVAAPDPTLSDDVTGRFRSLLEEWRSIAERSGTFHWSIELPVDMAEYLVHAFFRLAWRLAEQAEQHGGATAPPEGDRFYRLLVRSLLDALAADGGPSAAAFSEHLRSFWPGRLVGD